MSVPSTTTSAIPGTPTPKSGHKTIADFGLQRRRVDSFKQPEQFLEWIGDCDWKSYEVVDPKATQDDQVIFRYSVALEKNSLTTHFIETTTDVQKGSTRRTEMPARDMVADAYRAEGGDLKALKYLGTSSIINDPAQDMVKDEFEAQGKHISRPGHVELDPRSQSWKNISKTPFAKSKIRLAESLSGKETIEAKRIFFITEGEGQYPVPNLEYTIHTLTEYGPKVPGIKPPEPREKVSAADSNFPALNRFELGGGLDDQSVIRMGLDADFGTLLSTTTPHAPILHESKPGVDALNNSDTLATEPASPRSSEQTDSQDDSSLQDGNSEISDRSNSSGQSKSQGPSAQPDDQPGTGSSDHSDPPSQSSLQETSAQLDYQATMGSSDHSDQPDQNSSDDTFGQPDDQASTGSSDSDVMPTAPNDLASTGSSESKTTSAQPNHQNSTNPSVSAPRVAVWQVQLADIRERRRQLQVDMDILIGESERGHMYTEE
ncbi:hypothetical protein SUNI508_10190 [Seiridium unicorne]|uniref:Uncharacterized protein n=1 Tax=Seiridium unicorne TaxID=138068 RepID=A0ABR2UM53_9PEZI